MTIQELIEQQKKELAKDLVLDLKNKDDASDKDIDKNDKELEDNWFKAFAKRDVNSLKDLEKDIRSQYEAKEQSISGSTGDDGGHLMPITVEASIIQRQYVQSQIRQLATVLSGVTGELRLSAEGDTVEAYWVEEGAPATESTQKFSPVTLNPQKLVGFAKFTDEVLQKTASNPSVRDFVVNRLAAAANRLEAAAYVSGDGTNKPTGFRQATLPASNVKEQAAADLAITDILSLYRALPAQYRANGAFLAPDSALALVDGLTDSTGRPLLNAFDGDVDTIKRRPVHTEDEIPQNLGAGTDETEFWFGDFGFYYIADGSGMRVDYGTEGDDFKRSKISVRLIKYTDGGLILPEAVAKLTAVK